MLLLPGLGGAPPGNGTAYGRARRASRKRRGRPEPVTLSPLAGGGALCTHTAGDVRLCVSVCGVYVFCTHMDDEGELRHQAAQLLQTLRANQKWNTRKKEIPVSGSRVNVKGLGLLIGTKRSYKQYHHTTRCRGCAQHANQNKPAQAHAGCNRSITVVRSMSSEGASAAYCK